MTKFWTGSNSKHMQTTKFVLEMVENIVGKGENAGYFFKQALVFTCLQYKSFENLCEKKKLLLISPFPTVISTLLENFLHYS